MSPEKPGGPGRGRPEGDARRPSGRSTPAGAPAEPRRKAEGQPRPQKREPGRPGPATARRPRIAAPDPGAQGTGSTGTQGQTSTTQAVDAEQASATQTSQRTSTAPRQEKRRRLRRRRMRARKVRRVVRHVEPWSVLKISVLFYLALFLIALVASSLLWNLGRESGAVEQVEDLVSDLWVYGECPSEDDADTGVDPEAGEEQVAPPFGEEQAGDPEAEDGGEQGRTSRFDCPREELVGTYEIDGEYLFRAFMLAGLVLVVAGTAFNVVLAVLFNLISDLTGGVRVTVLEEQPGAVAAPARKAAPTGPPRTTNPA
jgi:hypothetical protein